VNRISQESAAQQIERIHREVLQKIIELDTQAQNEFWTYRNNDELRVQRQLFWQRKKQEIQTEAQNKINEIEERQRQIDDAQVVGTDAYGRLVTRKMQKGY